MDTLPTMNALLDLVLPLESEWEVSAPNPGSTSTAPVGAPDASTRTGPQPSAETDQVSGQCGGAIAAIGD